MEFFLRVLLVLATILSTVINFILSFLPLRKPTYGPITNQLLKKSVGDLVLDLRQRKVTSEQIVSLYIERIKEVNVCLNAVVEDRFDDALKEARHADQLIAKANSQQLATLFSLYPLLGIPFTVKESCGVRGLSYAVGSMQRLNTKCPQDGDVVERLRQAGCIPLLVSANPEFCLSFETNSAPHGRCLNPYDLRRTPAGSSGGEGSLNGSGASLFGLGSDIGGSIRLPAHFCGVFGHKPTGGLVSVKGHFPHSSTDPEFQQYLQLGPITRFARDLPILLSIMAGTNVEKLKFKEIVPLKDIKIFYAFGFDGLNGIMSPPVDFEIQLAIIKAVKCFEKGGLTTQKLDLDLFRNSMEITINGLAGIKGVPSIVTQTIKTKPSAATIALELFKSLIGHSLYTKEALTMEFAQRLNGLMTQGGRNRISEETSRLRQKFADILGTNGVLFLPTYHTTAIFHNTSLLNIGGIGLAAVFNILGFPATHVPMGLDRKGLPVGFQVVAAPYQDKLCLQIAAELEGAFGGWVAPVIN